ncbi:thiamine pyrophosphate-dependent dehydrogenase E1 component subunit alpha [Thermocrinis minervae]|uniref:Pyruvate dehydrogenase E1 component alpha subunit n=1 Tax=Thermocrinis minervae TaxID=381751 RepID=A0A1M6TJW4_9AQUI|nr:thiamine pyrophosphate-dependent enzyme [Thermocrinis minervae]SHK57189.1 pyruvate dehydrogenase E1 component alpha subunit [Thermocrinis minervae]
MSQLLAEKFYFLMKLGREFELRAKEKYLKGNISGFLHLDIGQEAVSVGAVIGFGKGDLFCPYREHVLALARGMDPKLIMAELFGKVTGVSKGKGGSMHLYEPKLDFYGGNAIVGAHLPHAVGAAYARKVRGEKAGVLAIFGDGATNGGSFFESINLATVWEVPVLFLCVNNFYAIGTRIERVSAFKDTYLKVKDYMPAVQVDGMDVFAVYEAVVKAKEYIQEHSKPYYIEAITYRFEGHSMADKPDYRPPREVEMFRRRDPIELLRQKALQMGWLTEEQINIIDRRVEQIVEEAVEFALNSPDPDVEELYRDVYCGVCADALP